MVREYGNSDEATEIADLFDGYLNIYGRGDITLFNREETNNAEGRISYQDAKESVVKGDLQFSNKLMSQYIREGIAVTGDGIFYTAGSVVIKANDEIKVSGVRWKLVTQVEGETVGTTVPYQGWVCRRA